MLFDWRRFQLYHLGFVAAAVLCVAIIVLLLPRDRRRAFLAMLLRGWLAGFIAGVILAGLMLVPVVGWYLSTGLNKLLPYTWKLGIRQPPLATILIVFNLLGILIGLVTAVVAVLRRRDPSGDDALMKP
jgi:MFS family permease